MIVSNAREFLNSKSEEYEERTLNDETGSELHSEIRLGYQWVIAKIILNRVMQSPLQGQFSDTFGD